MKRRIAVSGTATALLAMFTMAGCTASGPKAADAEEVTGGSDTDVAAKFSPRVEREFWLAIAEEPARYMKEARELLEAGDARGASADLITVASMLKFESRHSYSQDEARPLLLAVEELREVAGLMRSDENPEEWAPGTGALDRVIARTYRALGAHHVALARESMDEGDALMAGRYIQESAKDVERAFARARVDPGKVMEEDLDEARIIADHLVWDGDGDRSQGQAALGKLADALNGLGEVMGSRRK